VSSLLGMCKTLPLKGVAYCLARPDWCLFSDSPLALVQRQPWLTFIQRQPEVQPHLLASDHVSALTPRRC